ncbi:hypothetical protein Psfp_04143 [Pelotomaculum sp. FP]|uniref:hypothetical protein n=1 Tax=Pelotomaculum sp. FP TaxID=261474 RepID=UPI0010670F3B|nr:hypothetical protein [Pelotomaculum sp. FP]TEB10605.1 hypothetical protein Psfp_04143 [Pelotomaculum sp. FP]
MAENLKEKKYRCPKCNRMIFYYSLIGRMEMSIKCPRCGRVLVITITEEGAMTLASFKSKRWFPEPVAVANIN